MLPELACIVGLRNGEERRGRAAGDRDGGLDHFRAECGATALRVRLGFEARRGQMCGGVNVVRGRVLVGLVLVASVLAVRRSGRSGSGSEV